ncbi:MAG: endonuclease/exonuclease/phosphatase family protein [Casimicrobiaceae bacterium]
MIQRRSPIAWALVACALPWLAACVSLTTDPRALVYEAPGIKVQSLHCTPAARTALAFVPGAIARDTDALDPNAVRILMWNLHKEEDDGWEEDLTRLAQANDVLLLQEVTLRDPVQDVLHAAGLRWILASSFMVEDIDIGVLTATRAAPVANCTQRVVEPLLRIPKSAVITWLPLRGKPQTLAIANVHAINFTLTLGAYQAQLEALAEVLAAHQGPIVLGGDFNTWSVARGEALREIAARLHLVEITYADDQRAVFLGNRVDHVFVRGLDMVSSLVRPVTSSDHNPIEVVLRLAP